MSESRLQKLEGRTYHIDGKVAAIETQLGTQGAQLTRIEQHMLTPKPPVNYGVWVGIGITLLFGFSSLMMGVTGYVDMQLEHERAMAAVTVDRLEHQDERMHVADARLRLVEQAATAGNVSRRAIGDYAKELGAHLEALQTR